MEVRELNKKQETLPPAERDELVKKMRKEDDKIAQACSSFSMLKVDG